MAGEWKRAVEGVEPGLALGVQQQPPDRPRRDGVAAREAAAVLRGRAGADLRHEPAHDRGARDGRPRAGEASAKTLQERLGEVVVRNLVGVAHQRRQRGRAHGDQLGSVGGSLAREGRALHLDAARGQSRAEPLRHEQWRVGLEAAAEASQRAVVERQRRQRPDPGGHAKACGREAAPAVEEALVSVHMAGDTAYAGVANLAREPGKPGAAEGGVPEALDVDVAVERALLIQLAGGAGRGEDLRLGFHALERGRGGEQLLHRCRRTGPVGVARGQLLAGGCVGDPGAGGTAERTQLCGDGGERAIGPWRQAPASPRRAGRRRPSAARQRRAGRA